jgi:hypothetical protein
MKESKARFKITEEVQRDGVSHFWVYKRGWAPRLFFKSGVWCPDKLFRSMEQAENYVKETMEYEYNVQHPKQVRYY